MNMANPVDYLDSIEEWAASALAAHGWRLERRPFSGWPIPDGWNYSSNAVGSSGGEPFKVEILARWKPARPRPKRGEEIAQDCRRLQAVMESIWLVREALDRGDAVASMAATTSLDNSLQFFAKRRSDRDLRAYSKLDRPAAKILPDVNALRIELGEVAAGPAGKRGATAIVAGRYEVTAAAVRKALKKKENET